MIPLVCELFARPFTRSMMSVRLVIILSWMYNTGLLDPFLTPYRVYFETPRTYSSFKFSSPYEELWNCDLTLDNLMM